MSKEIILQNIANLEKWLKETPEDEDYLRLLKDYEEELI